MLTLSKSSIQDYLLFVNYSLSELEVLFERLFRYRIIVCSIEWMFISAQNVDPLRTSDPGPARAAQHRRSTLAKVVSRVLPMARTSQRDWTRTRNGTRRTKRYSARRTKHRALEDGTRQSAQTCESVPYCSLVTLAPSDSFAFRLVLAFVDKKVTKRPLGSCIPPTLYSICRSRAA